MINLDQIKNLLSLENDVEDISILNLEDIDFY